MAITSSATASLSSPGIGSGLDVNSIVSKLVSIESQPLNDLQTAASKIQTSISTYGQLQSLVSSLQTAAQSLGNPSLWKQTSATSTNAAVGVTASTGSAAAGNYTVSVASLAQAQNLASTAYMDSTAQVGSGTLAIQIGTWGSGNSFTPKSGSSTVNLTIAAGSTLANIRDQINAANAGVTASIVTDATGARLTISSANTGLDNQLRITATDSNGAALPPGAGLGALAYAPDVGGGGLCQTQAATNAQATINGLAIQSDSNTLSNVLSGVTLQLNSATSSPATVTVAPNTGAASTAINSFVSAYNALNSFLTTQTAYNAATKTAAPLQGDSTAIGLKFSMRTLLMGNGGGSSVFARLGDVGFSTAKDGTLSVDSTKLTAALANMPEMAKL
ncbi:MAG TPA: flagellar filament capping protein FliD, partial [Methylibium sp.]